MVHSSNGRGDTPRTLFKIILMLGLALVGVAAMAAEPPQPDMNSGAACAGSKLTFGGRIIENGLATDTWTLTCHRAPDQEAAMPTAPAAPTAPTAPTAKPVDVMPVATLPARQTGLAPGSGRF